MADHSKIEWTDATWNPITGCSVVSPGCTNCYAMKLAGTRLQHHPSRAGLTDDRKAGPVWNGKVRFNEKWLDQPLRWRRPRRIFVCAHGDLFHEAVPDEWIDRVFAVMALCPQHVFQVLTKRPERMKAWFEERWQGTPEQRLPGGVIIAAGRPTGRRSQVEEACEPLMSAFCSRFADPAIDRLWTADGRCKAMQWPWPLPNVWLGVSAEDQTRADERIPLLLDTPAAVRFLSAEPLLGPIDLTTVRHPARSGWLCPLTGNHQLQPIHADQRGPSLDWVIAGGESGKGAWPAHPDWFRSLRDQCIAAVVPFFFKQWGEWLPDFEQAADMPDDDPEQSRFATCVWNPMASRWDRTNGSWDDSEQWPTATDYWQPEQPMTRIGKKAAGRLLDGREWNEMPEAA